jgi:pimeloyl-ACP methyl ester carboxylesterase
LARGRQNDSIFPVARDRQNDSIFPVEGALPYARDLKTVETHLIDTGHFALEEDGAPIAWHIRRFLIDHVRPTQK